MAAAALVVDDAVRRVRVGRLARPIERVRNHQRRASPRAGGKEEQEQSAQLERAIAFAECDHSRSDQHHDADDEREPCRPAPGQDERASNKRDAGAPPRERRTRGRTQSGKEQRWQRDHAEVRHEVTIAERAARRAIQAHELTRHAVRLEQRRRCTNHPRQRQRRDECARVASAREGARAPEARRAANGDRHGAPRKPPVRREHRRHHAEHEPEREKLVGSRDGETLGTGEAEQGDDQRRNAQHQLLRHEETIEVEGLVGSGSDHGGHSARLQYTECDAPLSLRHALAGRSSRRDRGIHSPARE